MMVFLFLLDDLMGFYSFFFQCEHTWVRGEMFNQIRSNFPKFLGKHYKNQEIFVAILMWNQPRIELKKLELVHCCNTKTI